MKITFECPDEWINYIRKEIYVNKHKNPAMIAREALSFFLFSKYRKVEKERSTNPQEEK